MRLYHFFEHEFVRGGEDWFPLMAPRLLVTLDLFRYRWGDVVEVSPHPAAIGRRLGPSVLSDHNVDRWGLVHGIDVMPRGMERRRDAERAVRYLVEVGATAIGVYPHWQPGAGVHVGQRDSHRPGAPASWGAVRRDGKQVYVSLDEALGAMPL